MQLETMMRRAKLTPNEFAGLAGVSRVTVYNWIAKRSTPHALIKTKVDRLVQIVIALVLRGKLPLSPDLSKTERRGQLLKIKGALKKLTSA